MTNIIRSLMFLVLLIGCTNSPRQPAAESGTETGTETETQPEPLPEYSDGTARLNNMLGEGLNVTIPRGIYIITKELDIRDGHVIEGEKAGEVILKTAETYNEQILYFSDITVTVRNLVFDGNYSNRQALEGGQWAALVMITRGSNVTFENNTFQYGPSFGIWAAESSLIQIRNNNFHEVYFPIRVAGNSANYPSGADAGVIEKNTFKNTAAFKSLQHIEGIWTKNLKIIGNTFEGASLALPSIHSDPSIILGTWGNSVFLHDCTGYLVEDNTVGINYWSALVSGSNTTNGIIRNNNFSSKSDATIWIEQPGAEYITFEGNEVIGGLSIGDNGGNHLIIRNNIIRAKSTAIDATFGAKNILIEGNEFISTDPMNQNWGIYLYDKYFPEVNVRVRNNTFTGFEKGIWINNYNAHDPIVYGIKLQGNTFQNVANPIGINPGLTIDSSVDLSNE